MNWLVQLVPRTLLWRTFLLLSTLMLAAVLAWVFIYAWFEREPRSLATAQMLISTVNLTRTALVTGDPERRRELLQDLSKREGIRVYPSETGELLEPLAGDILTPRAMFEIKRQLGPYTRVASKREGYPGIFISFTLDDENEVERDEYWVMLPQSRLERSTTREWIGWSAAAMLLALGGAYLIVRRITQPLRRLSKAALQVGKGIQPDPLAETGPEELANVARAFNRMSSDLAQTDADRALILAGISHDLRTPLTRLRLEVEMSPADAATRDSMSTDIDEMDRVIGQFLDFSRLATPNRDGSNASAESAQSVDLYALLYEIVEGYARRNMVVDSDLHPVPLISGHATALRRVVSNLIDNAFRYAGSADASAQIEVALTKSADAQNPNIVLEIRDRGPGIPAEQRDRVKQPFVRLDAARTGAKGSGLGLAIVDRIIRAHDGRFQLLGRDGGGLIARITIPTAATTGTPAPAKMKTKKSRWNDTQMPDSQFPS